MLNYYRCSQCGHEWSDVWSVMTIALSVAIGLARTAQAGVTYSVVDPGEAQSLRLMEDVATYGGPVPICGDWRVRMVTSYTLNKITEGQVKKHICAKILPSKNRNFVLLQREEIATSPKSKEIYQCLMNATKDAARCTDNFSAYASTYIKKDGGWMVTIETIDDDPKYPGGYDIDEDQWKAAHDTSR